MDGSNLICELLIAIGQAKRFVLAVLFAAGISLALISYPMWQSPLISGIVAVVSVGVLLAAWIGC